MKSKHRLTGWALVQTLGLALIILIVVASLATLLIIIPGTPPIIKIIVLPFLIVAACSQLLLWGAFFHYLEIKPEGIEYHRFPIKPVTASWTDVEKVVIGTIYGIRFATLLARRTTPGFEFKQGIVTFGSRIYKSIPLSDFKGWKEGVILAELRNYKPELMVESPQKTDQQAGTI